MSTRFVPSRLVTVALLAGACLAWGACRSPDPGAASPAAAHAVQGAQLAGVMRQLDRLDRTLMVQDVDMAREQAWRLERIDQIATALEASASTIPGVVGDEALDEEELVEFVGYAEALEARAGELAAAARSGEGDVIRARLDALHLSCHACHERFRVPPIPVGASEAGAGR